jgi:hypothetical protein
MDTKPDAKPVAPLFDDMKPLEWLEEIDMAQYAETFAVNFTNGGSYISRKRLATVRLQDFPKMSIENFSHQKKLLEHIQHSLKYSFGNPVRKQEIAAKAKRANLRLAGEIEYIAGDDDEENEFDDDDYIPEEEG